MAILTLLLPNQSSDAHFQTLREWENCTFSSTSRNAKPHIFTYFAIMRPPSPTVAGTDPPPIRLRPVHVLPKQQRPLRSLLHGTILTSPFIAESINSTTRTPPMGSDPRIPPNHALSHAKSPPSKGCLPRIPPGILGGHFATGFRRTQPRTSTAGFPYDFAVQG